MKELSESTKATVELLAPAGNMACLHAAVQAGADAVYLGAGHFNARRGADNFTFDDLAQACDYAHLRGRHHQYRCDPGVENRPNAPCAEGSIRAADHCHPRRERTTDRQRRPGSGRPDDDL